MSDSAYTPVTFNHKLAHLDSFLVGSDGTSYGVNVTISRADYDALAGSPVNAGQPGEYRLIIGLGVQLVVRPFGGFPERALEATPISDPRD